MVGTMSRLGVQAVSLLERFRRKEFGEILMLNVRDHKDLAEREEMRMDVARERVRNLDIQGFQPLQVSHLGRSPVRQAKQCADATCQKTSTREPSARPPNPSDTMRKFGRPPEIEVAAARAPARSPCSDCTCRAPSGARRTREPGSPALRPVRESSSACRAARASARRGPPSHGRTVLSSLK